MIEIHFNKEDNIIYGKTSGEVTIKQMLDAHRKMMARPDLPENIRILEDATIATINLSLADIKELRDLIEESSSKFAFAKHAVILNNNKGAAFGMWFEEHSIHLNYKLKMFHSPIAAKKWLML